MTVLENGITLEEAIWHFMQDLGEQGKSSITISAYGSDLKQAVAFFGAECPLSRLTLPWVGRFLKSPQLLEKAPEQDRALPSVKRSVRVFRMLIFYCQKQGWLETVPLPKAISRGRAA
jgi:site-specific recombinase XerD